MELDLTDYVLCIAFDYFPSPPPPSPPPGENIYSFNGYFHL